MNRITFLGLWLATLFLFMAAASFGVVAPSIKAKLGVSAFELGLLGSAGRIGYIFAPALASFYSRISRRKSLLVSLVIGEVGVVVLFFSTSFYTAFAGYTLVGFAVASLLVNSMIFMAVEFPAAQGFALNLLLTSWGLASFSSPILTGISLNSNPDWRVVYEYFAIAGLPLFLLLVQGNRASLHVVTDKSDRQQGLKKRNRKALGLVLLSTGLQSGAEGAIVTFLVLFLTTIGTVDIFYAGLLLGVTQAMHIPGRLFWSRTSDRFGIIRTVIVSSVMGSLLLGLGFAFVSSIYCILLLPAAMIFISGGFPNLSATAAVVSDNEPSFSTGLVIFASGVGPFLAQPIVGGLMEPFGIEPAMMVIPTMLMSISLLMLWTRKVVSKKTARS